MSDNVTFGKIRIFQPTETHEQDNVPAEDEQYYIISSECIINKYESMWFLASDGHSFCTDINKAGRFDVHKMHDFVIAERGYALPCNLFDSNGRLRKYLKTVLYRDWHVIDEIKSFRKQILFEKGAKE